ARISVAQQTHRGAQNAAIVDTGMLEKAPVFGGHECVDYVLREVVVAHDDASPLADLIDQSSVAAINAQWNLQRDLADRLCLRQTRCDIVIGSDHGSGQSQHQGQPEACKKHEPPGVAALVWRV